MLIAYKIKTCNAVITGYGKNINVIAKSEEQGVSSLE